MRSMVGARIFKAEACICLTPAASPDVHTLVARNALPCACISDSSVPTTSSARPYMGELSITRPPASNRTRSTSLRWSSAWRSGPTSKVCQVPRPTTGSGSLL